MRLRHSIVLTLAFVLAGCTGSAGAVAPSTPPAASAAPTVTPSTGDSTAIPSTFVDIGAGLKGPAGLTATVLATGLPDAAAFAFDAVGRLWVATAAFSDDSSDAIYVVESQRVAAMKILADVHTPLGLVWDDGTLYVASAGRIEAFSGFTDSTFSARKTVLTLEKGVGEVNGLALAPDGRLLVGVSAPCDACASSSSQAAAVLSVLPDSTGLHVVASEIRAPVGLAFMPGTDDLLVTMNQRDDLGDATPGDWLALVRDGQKWGFPDCYGQGGDACDGVPDPVAVLDKHAAVSGVAVVTGGFGPLQGASAFVAEWATGSVVRVALTRSADWLGWTGTAEPFLVGISRPVAVATAPDGALVVGDWESGTIYRISAT